ncbi:hypothetical protein NUW58_g2864 [Xylaria curta]|uniref:Uncharacterized protein n=1 Tax=Xylaria curta TaxID=42375 RepID=A0ACC1PDL6_9PEZI|nr:hypothetical protein NUW58_g2864 [Xylaria curta]
MGVIRELRIPEDNARMDGNGEMVYIPCWLFLFCCPIFVALRFWSRKRTDSGLGADDYTILFSLASAITTNIFGIHGYNSGYGQHAAALTEHQRYEAFRSFYVMQVTYKVSLNLTKASILLLYLRIFVNVKWFKWTCYILLGFIAISSTAITIATILQCLPIEASFNKSITNATCINTGPFWYASAGLYITTDIIILIIPMPLIYSLQLPLLRKAIAMFAFALGAFVVVIAVLRVKSIDNQVTSPDPLYDVISTMWTIIEINLAIICACLPPVSRLIIDLVVQIKAAYFPSKAKPNLGQGWFIRQADNNEEEDWNIFVSRKNCGMNSACARGPGSDMISTHKNRHTSMEIRMTFDRKVEYSKPKLTPKEDCFGLGRDKSLSRISQVTTSSSDLPASGSGPTGENAALKVEERPDFFSDTAEEKSQDFPAVRVTMACSRKIPQN